MSIAQWQFDHVAQFPKEVGLVIGEERWTNADLHAESCGIAAVLLSLGVSPGDRVAVALPNSRELFVVTAGISIAGAALVLLGDTNSDELNSRLHHCAPRVVLCRKATGIALTPSARSVVVTVDGTSSPTTIALTDLQSGESAVQDFVKVEDSDLAQLCYTSGSTGKPKAVPYTHGGLKRFLHAFATQIPDRRKLTRFLVCVPPTTFVGRLLTIRSVANNQYFVLTTFDPERALATIERHRIEQLSLLPTMAAQLVACAERCSFDCSSLHFINIGGAHVPQGLVDGLKRMTAGPTDGKTAVHVSVQYGMTEAGGGIATSTVGGDGVVGHLCSGVTVRIEGPDGLERPLGDIGEIVVRTPYSPDQYWGDPQQSEGVFRNGYVHTGDLGYFREDGQLCLVGRRKDVIIQGGINIHPAEMLNVLSRVPGIRDCAVMGTAEEVLGEAVVVCAVREEEGKPTEEDIRADFRKSMEVAKQPVHVFFLEEIPRTTTGKVDGGKLKDLVALRLAGSARYQDRGRNWALLDAAALVSATLYGLLREHGGEGAAESRLDENVPFGELGVSSLLAVRFAHEIGLRLGMEVPHVLAYSCPTISACAQWIVAATGAGAGRSSDLTQITRPGHSSVAIVGIGVRLPGRVSTPADFWDLLCNEREVVSDPSVWRHRPGAKPWRAAFDDRIADFDAAFFRLGAEAAELDPRHRGLLEVCWEGLEDAGIDPTSIAGDRTGVFLGLSGEHYASASGLGGAVGMAVGYVCHFFDIRGPALTFDTTCSSSLVALHHAAESLKRGECDIALVGSSNVLFSPVASDALGVMSPDGLTRAFDASACGFGQGEGTLVIVLRRHEESSAPGDRVYARILGSAINHDGRSTSLTAPNPAAQARVIAAAMRAASVRGLDVQYLEAHGTGTALGDPVELDGIERSMCDQRRAPIAIGSVKTNLGHLEAAAGLAGTVKVALAIHFRELPASRRCTRPNPAIPWARIPARVQTHRGAWPDPERSLIAGVSAFGMSGTNAHVVLGEAAQRPRRAQMASNTRRGARHWLIPVSARTELALRAALKQWIPVFEQAGGPDVQDIACSAAFSRAHLPWRTTLVGQTPEEFCERLRVLCTKDGASCALASGAPRKLALVFCGQGSQWNGMGRELLVQQPVFRNEMHRCTSIIQAYAGWDLLKELSRPDMESCLDKTEITQPALIAIQASIHQLLKSWGIQAVAAVGHSAGEITAAFAAGLLSLEEALQIACARGRVSADSPPGAMLAARISEAEAESLCSDSAGSLEIAAVNGPRSVVLSGDRQCVTAVAEQLGGLGLRAVVLRGEHAFHSSRMEGAALRLGESLSIPPARALSLRLVSTLTGTSLDRADSTYWRRQLRERVNFAGALRNLIDDGVDTFLEIGPHPVLADAIAEAPGTANTSPFRLITGAMRRGAGGDDVILESVGRLYCHGVAVDWRSIAGDSGNYVDLPRYQWEHQSYWLSEQPPHVTGAAAGSSTAQADLPLVPDVRVDARTRLHQALGGLTDCDIDTQDEAATLEDLGIDSLGQIQLRNRLGITSDNTRCLLNGASTLRDLLEVVPQGKSVERIGTDGPKRRSGIHWLRRGEGAPINIWIHPAGGGLDCYRPLADRLEGDSVAINAADDPPASIEEAASNYIGQIDRLALAEPLILIGWSFGGVVAYEMARQWTKLGRSVAQVTMIDPFVGADLGRIINTGASSADAAQEALSDQSRKHARLHEAHAELLLNYVPQRYGGEVLLIRAVPARGDPDATWRKAAIHLHVVTLEGDHFSILGAAATARVAPLLRYTSRTAGSPIAQRGGV